MNEKKYAPQLSHIAALILLSFLNTTIPIKFALL